MQASHVIFDFGGVVFRWNPLHLLARVLPARANTPAAAEHWKGLFFQNYSGDWGAFDSGLIDMAETCRRIAARTGLAQAEVQAVLDAVPDELVPQPETVALMRRLREAGHRLYYLSNMPAPYAQHLQRTHDFMAWFDDGVFSSTVKMAKPEPAIFKLALRQFDISPGETVFIDDHAPHVDAARALGLTAFVFTDAELLARDLVARRLLAAV
jgi:HAD superfamily hydrolase (TIGR01509 family)